MNLLTKYSYIYGDIDRHYVDFTSYVQEKYRIYGGGLCYSYDLNKHDYWYTLRGRKLKKMFYTYISCFICFGFMKQIIYTDPKRTWSGIKFLNNYDWKKYESNNKI